MTKTDTAAQSAGKSSNSVSPAGMMEYCEHGFIRMMCANCLAKEDHELAKKMKHFQTKKRPKHPKTVK